LFSANAADLYYYAGYTQYSLELIKDKRAILLPHETMKGRDNDVKRIGTRIRYVNDEVKDKDNSTNIIGTTHRFIRLIWIFPWLMILLPHYQL